ncbi:MAG: class I SAM-dependent methyltransferase [Actinobacteria bacterium]|nr:class I SAM-dependent methyltransferase [Actinomycetota bacterium]
MGTAKVQGALWGAAARDWSELNEPHCAVLYEAVFDAIGADGSTVLLDAGCGSGLALQIAAKRGATVSGFDASAGLLEIAAERVPGADLRHGDLESLPYRDGTFNAVTSFNAVQYAADPVAALRELKRVAQPGSPVAVVSWGDPERCETRTILAAIGGLLPPPPPGAGGPFALAAPGKLEELLAQAGLTSADSGEVRQRFSFPDLEMAVRAQMASGPARRAIEHAGADATAAAITGAYVGNAQADGSYVQRNIFRYVIGRA